MEQELQELTLRIKELEEEIETEKQLAKDTVEKQSKRVKELEEINQKYYNKLITQKPEDVVVDEGNETETETSYDDFLNTLKSGIKNIR